VCDRVARRSYFTKRQRREMHLLLGCALRAMPARPGVLPTMILVTVTVTPLYWGDRYVHRDHDGALAARMRQKTGMPPRPGRVSHRGGPAPGLQRHHGC
jgi:hypothetical protein